MASLVLSDQPNKSKLSIPSFDNPHSLGIIPFLCQRVSSAPCLRILYYLDGRALLNLRLVSKMNPDEDKIVSDLTGGRVRFVVDGSEECNAGMIPSYLMFRWSSLVFPKTLDRDDMYLALQSAHLLITKYSAHIQDLTISPGLVPMEQAGRIMKPLFKRLASLTVISGSDINVLSGLLSYCESLRKLDLSGYTGINTMILGLGQQGKLAQIFQKVEKLNLSETGITYRPLRRLLLACAPLKSLNLNECTHVSTAINEMTEEQVHKVFGQVEDLNLGASLITPEVLSKIAASKPPLQELGLYQCQNLSGFYDQECIFQKVRYLNLGHTNIRWRPLLNILASCQDLEQLFLGGCQAVSKAIETFTPEDKLSKVVHRLEVMVLSNTNISEKALSSLLLSCRSLQFLDVNSCNAFPAVLASMSDETIKSIVQGIYYLDMGGLSDVPSKDFERLLGQFSNLQFLLLPGSKWISAFIEGCEEESLGKLFGGLMVIDLSEADISKEALHKCLRVCKALQVLKILGSSKLTDLIDDLDEESIQALLGPKVQLNVRKADLSKESYEKLVKALPRFDGKLW